MQVPFAELCLLVFCFEMSVGTPMQTVIDNAFDKRHFQSVHGVGTDDFAVWTNDHGALIVESMMHVPSFEPNAAPGAAPRRTNSGSTSAQLPTRPTESSCPFTRASSSCRKASSSEYVIRSQ